MIVCAACSNPSGTGVFGGGTATATNTASTFTPVTGIQIDAHDLFLRQGCGTEPGQVYKYAVVVFQKRNVLPCSSGAPEAVGVGVYDCFADAVFVNVGSGTALGLSQDFDLAVAAFDAPTYAAQAGLVTSEVLDLQTTACPSGPVDDRAAALAAAANWTTTCTARQQPNVESLAACDPLQESANAADAGAGD
ncbi:MAG TPA: hypothetical protein VLM85_07625 [Polyangiaceae bacterium]|nr:hypothetical protein [Polyangiaceae bacterium]